MPPFIGWDINVGVEMFLGGDGHDAAQTQMRFPPIGTPEESLGERAYTQQLTGRAHLGWMLLAEAGRQRKWRPRTEEITFLSVLLSRSL